MRFRTGFGGRLLRTLDLMDPMPTFGTDSA
jgi:hypothetical protein